MRTRPGGSAATSDDRVPAIEDAFLAHWSHFGRWSHGELHERDGVTWFETPIPHLPYNMVMRTRIPGDLDADSVIDRVATRFRARNVPYLWAHHPSDSPGDLGQRLARHGLDLVETATGMDLELDGWQPKPDRCDAEILQADNDPDRLRDYTELIRTYWSVPESARDLIDAFNTEWAGDRSPGVRLIAYRQGMPMAKLFLNTVQSPDLVAVYGVATKPEARRTGVATALMNAALRIGASMGARRCVLHSSEMAVSLYRHMGFTERCHIHAYATGPLFGTHHH